MATAEEARRELARRELARRRGGQQPSATDQYYNSGIFAGEYNPLGSVARSLDAATTAAGDVLTFGWGDELSGMMGGNTDVARQRQEELGQSNPIASTVGMLGGGLGAGAALGPASITARATSAATPLLGRSAAGMADGAIAGGIYGLGSGADASSRLEQGAIGAGIGGAFGAGFPVVSDLVGAGVTAFRNSRQAGPIAQQAGVAPETVRALGNIIEGDGSLGAAGQANMRAAGQEAMLADAGPTARSVLDTAIQRGGPGAIMARQRIGDRVGRDATALTQTLDNSLGAPQGVGTAQNQIRDASRPGVNQAYDRAYNSPIDYSSDAGRRVEDIINRMPDRIAGRAINAAVDRMNYDGSPGPQIMARILDDGSVEFQGMPNVMQADYIKRALDEIAQDGIDPITGRMSSDAAFASRIARDLRNAVGEAVPAYREALESAADPLSRQSAVRLGTQLPRMPRDQFGMAVDGMTGPEREAVRQGFRSQLDDQMSRVQRAVSDGDMDAREAIRGLRELSSRQSRENLRSVMDASEADALFDEVDRITRSFELRAGVTDNSRTYGRQATDQRVQDMTTPGVVRTAARGEGINATRRLIQALTGETDDALRGRQDAIYSEIADLLTRQGGPGQNVYNAVQGINQTDAATRLLTDRIAALLSAPRLAYPASALSQESLR